MVEKGKVHEFKLELIDSIPKVIIYAGTAFFIWLFTTVIFLPLGQGITLYGDVQASAAMSAIAFLAIAILLLKILKELRDFSDALAGLIAFTLDPKATSDVYLIYQKVLKSLLYVLVAAVIYLFLRSLLDEISPALSGILLVVIFIWAIGMLYSAGMLLRDKIQPRAKKAAARIIEPEK